MRIVSALLFVALTGTAGIADEASPATNPAEANATWRASAADPTAGKVPLRVVRMLPETHQVLLIHKNRGTHVVAEVGQEVDGFIVDEITADEVTLVASTGAEVILTAPDATWRRRAAERRAATAKRAPAAAVVTTDPARIGVPVDPYADIPARSVSAATTEPAGDVRVASAAGVPSPAATPTPAPAMAPMATPTAAPAMAPMATPAPTTSTPTALPPATPAPAPATTSVPTDAPPADPYADLDPGIAAFADAVGASPVPAPAVPAVPPAPAATPKGATAITLARADIDAALADFGATAVTFDAAFVPTGLRIDSIVAGTLLAKAGLRTGDVITSIDGKPLRSFDDAADLYARMQTAKSATIVVQRGGAPVTLAVTIR